MPTSDERRRSKRRRELGLAWCSSCKADKPQSQFGKCPGRRPFGLTSLCLDCDRGRKTLQKRRYYWSLDEDGRRAFNRKSNLQGKFGIDESDYQEMLQLQNGVCAICSCPETVKHHSTNEIQPLVVDHDHGTGRVRGLLCTRCNKGIGLLKHNPEFLRAAADYLIETWADVKIINKDGSRESRPKSNNRRKPRITRT